MKKYILIFFLLNVFCFAAAPTQILFKNIYLGKTFFIEDENYLELQTFEELVTGEYIGINDIEEIALWIHATYTWEVLDLEPINQNRMHIVFPNEIENTKLRVKVNNQFSYSKNFSVQTRTTSHKEITESNNVGTDINLTYIENSNEISSNVAFLFDNCSNIAIYDLLGNNVYSDDMRSSSKLNVESLNIGAYYMILAKDGIIFKYRFIKS